MLYMIISTHSPESCPITNPKSMEKMIFSNQHMDEIAKKLGVTVKGMWADMGAHTTFALLDAPKPELLGQMAVELRLMEWNTSFTHPVITLEEAMAVLQQQKK